MKEDNIIDWISDWFTNECDGDWEHENQIKIQTLDNPGWDIVIDLRYTDLENLNLNHTLIEASEHDWYFYSIKDKKFNAAGDLSKLNFLLEKFKEIVRSHQIDTPR